MNHSSPLAVVWDEKHIKALLGLHRYPESMLQVEPWQSWVKQHGGLNILRQKIRNSLLFSPHSKLLSLVLDHPGSSSIFYADKLHLSSSSYFNYLNQFIQALQEELNSATSSLNKPAILTNLPVPLTALIGAEQSIANVVALLRKPEIRLLTVTGPGGVGKTRLAIAAGAELQNDFSHGVFYISLETINDSALLSTQIAHILNLETIGTQSLLYTLKTYLEARQLLLILDNFEQLVESAPLITDLLKAAGNLKVLVTSREVLNVYGENRFTVPELVLPDPQNPPPLEQLSQWPAPALFIQRLQARYPAFAPTESNKASILGICQQLDGLPLAIELAASQIKFLFLDQMLPQLDNSLKSLRDTSRSRPTRQKTLWATIDWSYQLISDDEKMLFRRLAVFGRAWSLDAAQAICEMADASTSLDALVDKSLLRYAPQTANASPRFEMLQAVREYALEQLIHSTELETVQRRHADYFLKMVELAEPMIGTHRQDDWVQQIRLEHENLQIALSWMLNHAEIEMLFRLLGAVWRFYNMLNIWSETRLWMDRALAKGSHLKSVEHVKVLWGASWLAANQGDYAHAVPLARDGLALAREIGDKRLIALLMQNVANGLTRRREYDRAINLFEESLACFRELHDQEETAWVLAHIAEIFWQQGNLKKSQQLLRESMGIFRAMQHQWALATILRQLGRLTLEDGDLAQSASLLEESLTISKTIHTKQRISETLRDLALLHWRQGDFEKVKADLSESLAISQEIGDQMGLGWIFNFQGRLMLQESEIATAIGLFEKAQIIFQQIGDETAIKLNSEYLEQVRSIENKGSPVSDEKF